MVAKKPPSRPSSDDSDDLSRPTKLQALLLADSFAQSFRPITLQRPKVLLPLINAPMIDYTLAWLQSVAVNEVFVFCCAHAEQIKDYLSKSDWIKNNSPGFTVTAIESHNAASAGDALRTVYELGVIQRDFVLISGDTISNMSLEEALREHRERKKKDSHAIMTMVIKQSKPSGLTHQTRLGNDEIIMAVDPVSKELLYYDDKAEVTRQTISLDKMLLSNDPGLYLHNDKQDCHIDICSPEVLSLFQDNFDYQHLRRHFVKGLLIDDIMGYKIFTHEIRSSYAARIDNFRSYDTISKDILQRWTYPLVPDVQYFGNYPPIKLDRQGIYKAHDVILSRTAQVGAFSLIGAGTSIGDNSVIINSVIGEGCSIGSNVLIQGSYIWNSVTIEDNCKLSHALVCDGVHLRAGVTLEPGVVLSFKVEVGQHMVITAYSKVSLLPQPSKQDSDDELEYADASSGVLESPTISSMKVASHVDPASDSSDTEQHSDSEVGISGVGYIWSECEGGLEEQWRHSIAPITADKLLELSSITHADHPIASSQDVVTNPSPGNIPSDGETTDSEIEDSKDADFEKEVEATFQRALSGENKDNVILEINALRLSYNMSQSDCAGALFYSLLKSALAVPYSSKKELYENTETTIMKWKDLLKNYLKTNDEEIEVILKFEEMCLETALEFAPMFSKVLHYLYDNDILSEAAILAWADEKEEAEESDKIFLKQAQDFIKWLREAPEEDDEEEEEDED